MEEELKYRIDYLLRYISNETFMSILNKKSKYILKLLEDNYIDVDLNIKYLVKYGITNIDKVVYSIRLTGSIIPNNYTVYNNFETWYRQ